MTIQHRALPVIGVGLAIAASVVMPAGAMGQCPASFDHVQAGYRGVGREVRAIARTAEGDSIIAGELTSAGGLTVANIARYSAATGTWSAMGGGTNGRVNAVAVGPTGLVYAGGLFGRVGGVAGVGAGGIVASRIAVFDPSSGQWSALPGTVTGEVKALLVLPGGDVLVGGNFTMPGNINRLARYSPSSGTWAATSAQLNTVTVDSLALMGDGRVLVGSSSSGLRVFNPATNTVTTIIDVQGQVNAVGVAPNGDVVVGGYFDPIGETTSRSIAVYRASTNEWMSLGAGIPFGQVRAVRMLANGDVLAGGYFPQSTALYSPSVAVMHYSAASGTWTRLSVAGEVFAFGAEVEGSVLVGGTYAATGVRSFGALSTSTLTFTALNDGIDGSIVAMAKLGDGRVLAGGTFTAVDDMLARGAALYDPQTRAWSPAGAGTNGIVRDLEVLPNGQVVFGLQDAEWLQTGLDRGISRFDPSTGAWTVDDRGPSGDVYAVEVMPGGNIIAGGYFEKIGSLNNYVDARAIARYVAATDTWQALGQPVFTDVSFVEVMGNGVIFAAGRPLAPDSPNQSRVFRYEPSSNTWTLISVPSSPSVNIAGMSLVGDSDLIVTGYFTMMGGTAAVNRARYNIATGTWSTWGVGRVAAVVSTLALENGELLVAGEFVAGSGLPARGLVRWRAATDTWTPVAAWTTGSVGAMTVGDGTASDSETLFVGGNFQGEGTPPTTYFAELATPAFCAADFDCSGAASVDDIFMYLNAWFALEPRTDVDGVIGVSIDDIFIYLNLWFAGC